MRTHRLIYEGLEEDFYVEDNFSKFVLSGLVEKLNLNSLKINPEKINNYTIYHMPHLGTGIQYLKGEGIHLGKVQVGLLGKESNLIGNILLEEAKKFKS